MDWAVRAAAYFVVSVGLYAILSRTVAGNGVMKFFLSGTLTGLGLVIHQSFLGDVRSVAAAALSYAFVCELFIFFIAFVGSSVSVSLLLMLRSRSLSDGEIDALYADEVMVHERIGKLLKTGLLQETPRRLTGRGERLLTAFRFCKRFFRHEGPERTL